jgi:hypothetical protein
MATTKNDQDPKPIAVESAMTGILALLIAEREERTADDKNAVRTEVLLADAGLSLEEIVVVTGRKYDAVRMAVSRGRAKRSKAG